MKHLERIGPTLLILFSIGISIFLAYTATQRTLTGLESTLWQIFVFAGGLAGSFIFGRQSAREAAKEIIKPHARGAARYLISLYKSILRARSAATIEASQDLAPSAGDHVIRAYLIAIFTEQLATADDALENWRDILDEELEDLIEKLREDNTTPEELESLIGKLREDNTNEV
ncbi:MAG: hypothetical protein OXU51_09190 [Candidatus Poribacteria bacterium]|nr:hypothetical protein [Candidatus Poribacteria bacterium]